MKYQSTRKEINNGYARIIGIGYCNAQFLLNYREPESYCAGVNGWSCDNYNVNGVCISTGYNHLSSKNVTANGISYDNVRKYDQLAFNALQSRGLDWKEQRAEIEELLNQFVGECTERGAE